MDEHLPNAPITEAVLDVQVRARQGIVASEFLAVREQLKSEFPKVVERTPVVATFDMNPEAPAATVNKPGPDGFIFWSADGKDAAQFRVDGFSVNRLKPYPGWDHWFPQFVRLWQLYVAVAKPVAVVRTAARCINHIALAPDRGLDDYLNIPPRTPSGMPSSLKGYLSRIELSDAAAPETGVAIVQGIVLDPKAAGPQLLLDIDAYKLFEFRPEEVIGLFGALRKLRNAAFFQTLTPQAIEDFR